MPLDIDIQYIAIVLGTILLSMTLHEVMHGLVAFILGDDTAKHQGRLTLNPLKHIDPFMTVVLPIFLAISGLPIFGGAKPVQFDPTKIRYGEWGVAMVAAAGPLTNLIIAFIAFGVGVVSGVITADGVLMSLSGTIIITVVGVNLGFFIFNTLPIPPLDGSRVFYALAPDFIRRGMEFIERSGGVMVVFILVLLFSGYIGSFMASVISAILDVFSLIFGV